jgi:hypothetical protein
MAASDFVALLDAGDLDGLIELWRRSPPHLRPKDYREAEIMMHVVRTGSRAVRMRCRAWSHRWLVERGLPSSLPDILKPRAERLYPVVVGAVAIASMQQAPTTLPLRRVMQDAVLEVYGDYRQPDPDVVRSRMLEARAREWRRLLGS